MDHPHDLMTRAEYDALVGEMEDEREHAFDLPDDVTLAAWEAESIPGEDVVYVDDPWSETAEPLALDLTVGEWMMAGSLACLALELLAAALRDGGV